MPESESNSAKLYFKLLIVVSLLFCIFYLFVHSNSPVFDGDSYEYAGIARNLYELGYLREDLLRSYAIKDQPLPHPPAQRANLYVYLLVPFYAVFKNTNFTFIVPCIIALFALPLIVFRVGRKLFSPKVGFCAALLTMFNPQLIYNYTTADSGLPDIFQMIFYLLFVLVLIEERYALAGILMALAYLFRNNSVVLIPGALCWLFLYRRRALFGAPAVKMLGIAFIIVLPFLIRSAIVFHNPFYSEQFKGVSRGYSGEMADHLEKGNLFGILFNYEEYNKIPSQKIESRIHAANYIFHAIYINIKMSLWGSRWDIGFLPGIFQMLSPLLLPFLILGIIRCRGKPHSLLFMIFALQTCLHAVLLIYSDRYLLCVLPLAYLLAVHGVEETQKILTRHLPILEKKSLSLGLVLFLLMTETLPLEIFTATKLLSPRKDNVYHELKTTCDWIRTQTPGNTVLMTYPFFSPHFPCRRYTVPLPYGNIYTMTKILKKYKADYIIYGKVWPKDLFPDLPFTETVVRGSYITLLRVDFNKLNRYQQYHDRFYLNSLNPVDYFLSGHFNFEFLPPAYKLSIHFTRNFVLGTLTYLLYIGLFFFFFYNTGFIRRVLPIILLLGFVVILKHTHLKGIVSDLVKNPPAFSRIQAEMVLQKSLPQKNQTLFYIHEESPPVPAEPEIFRPYFKSVLIEQKIPADIGAQEIIFIPLPPITILLFNRDAFMMNMEIQKSRDEIQVNLMQAYKRHGFNATPIYGGIFLYKKFL